MTPAERDSARIRAALDELDQRIEAARANVHYALLGEVDHVVALELAAAMLLQLALIRKGMPS